MRAIVTGVAVWGVSGFRSKFQSDSDLPGYRVDEGHKCPGRWIEFWDDGGYAHYGKASHHYTDVNECGKTCNLHAECDGFYTKNGVCSHWRHGDLKHAQGSLHDGHTCYVKLQGSAPIPHAAAVKKHTNIQVPGYKVAEGTKCPGSWVEFWKDGEYAFYGKADGRHPFTDVVQCAKECNKHDECAGFYTKSGKCSHWRRGELQDIPGHKKWGHNCYVKWEVQDLSAIGPVSVHKAAAPRTNIKPSGPQVSDCLCVWDVDRTLTAKQGTEGSCPNTEPHPSIPDHAYYGGSLILSDLALNIKNSYCGKCYFGAVSAGTASGEGSAERVKLDTLVDSKFNVGGWVDNCPSPVWGTKVMACGEGVSKQNAVKDIVAWLGKNGVHISNSNVHFFDDKPNNIQGFIGGPFNAHQVSCNSRDGHRGLCGGTKDEIRSEAEQKLCT